jgi:hypothetical protein
MVDRSLVIAELCTVFALFLWYVSSNNLGYLVICLGVIGVLIYTFKLFNFNRVIYYVALLCVLVVQTILLINTYLIQMTYLQNNEQYVVCAVGFLAYIVVVLLFKPNIFLKRSSQHIM